MSFLSPKIPKLPKVPKPKPVPVPTPADAAREGSFDNPQINYQSLISTSAIGLTRKARTAKRSLIGGA